MEIIESRSEYASLLPEGSSIFYQPFYLDIISPDWTAFVGKCNGKPVWLWPGVLKSFAGFKVFSASKFVYENAPIILNEDTQSLGLEKIFNFGHAVFADRGNHLSNLMSSKWEVVHKYRQEINLINLPSEIGNFNKKLKKKFAKIKKKGTFKIIETKELSDFYKIYLTTTKRAGISTSPLDAFERIYDLKKLSFVKVKLFMLYNDRVPIASQGFLGFENKAYGFFRSKNYEKRVANSQEYITWHVFQQAKLAYDVFDMRGSDINGVRRFNKHLGGVDCKYKVYKLTKPPIMKNIIQYLI